VVVETTGLADPAPILSTLLTEPVVHHHFEPGAVIATVDAVNGLRQLARQPESLKQVAAADRLVVTKTDIAEPARVAELERRLRTLNPAATLLEAVRGEIDPRELLGPPSRKPGPAPADPLAHTDGVRAFSLTFDEALDWNAFGIWLTMLLQSRGEEVLRVKGLLNVGEPGPLLLNGVQHVIHPPVHLDNWPDADRRSRIVFIARDLDPSLVEASLAAFNRAAG